MKFNENQITTYGLTHAILRAVGAKAYIYRNYLIWALSKATEGKPLEDVLRDLIIAHVETSSNGFSILSTSAHGTSITYGELNTEGLTVAGIHQVFDLLYRRCRQAAEYLGEGATDQQIADLVMTVLYPRKRFILRHQNIRGVL